jgi:two-component system cell cycle sensor histidine kinase/response regulator CckA
MADGLHRLTGDVTQLQQVLLNLCINARDAMPNGGTLLVEAKNVTLQGDHPGDHVRLRVADSGEGMPPEVRQKVFEPFFTTKTQGTGIGLATVASIVRRHGGFIELDSTPGEGTEFRVLLPVAPKMPWGQPYAAPDLSGEGRLLLVLEEGSLLEIVKGTLEAYGYRVLCATSAEQALAAYRSDQAEIAAVLANVSIPGLDAIQLIRDLAHENPQVKVLNTSGLSVTLTDGGVESIVRATLARPYSADKLLEVVGQVLEMA